SRCAGHSNYQLCVEARYAHQAHANSGYIKEDRKPNLTTEAVIAN
ncbi:hypothetical protein A2U01_0114179, partial [Trifolium medium]|nr:hypothetical protein [Trifolium medium]